MDAKVKAVEDCIDALAFNIDNTSAWESFDQGVSDAISEVVERVRAFLSDHARLVEELADAKGEVERLNTVLDLMRKDVGWKPGNGGLREWVQRLVDKATHGLPEPTDAAVREQRLDAALARLDTALRAPQDAKVREAVGRLENSEYTIALDGSQDDTPQMWADIDVLIAYVRAVQSQRLTGERMEAIQVAYYMLEGAGLEGGVRLLRAAFPELADGN